MAKKSSKKSVIFLAAVLCGIVALVMYVFPMLKYHLDGVLNGSYIETNYTGINMLFDLENCKNVDYSALTKIKLEATVSTKFVVGPLIAAICTIVGIVAALLTAAVGKKNKGIVKIVAFVCFIAAAVLVMVLTKSTFVSANEIGESSAEHFKLAIGAYLACGFNAVAGLLSLAA